MWSSVREAARGLFGGGRDESRAPLAVAGAGAREQWHACDEAIMGTAIRVELLCGDAREAGAAIDEVMREMHRIDRAMSPYKEDSELSRINREAALRAVPVSAEMAELLERSIAFSRISEGAFDVTYASAGRLYDYRERIRPEPAALERARAAIGFRNLLVDRRAGTVRFAQPGVCIDLGGIAKGHAVERGAALLRRRGIRHAIVTAGGDSRIVGDRGGRPWMIGVRDPRRAGELAAVLPLRDAAVSTSGDYERYFEEDGRRHHHILDPRTGVSPCALRGVTVVAPDGWTSEAMSKTVFVLGLERGMRLVDAQPGVDAIAIDARGVLHYSRGLRPATRSTDCSGTQPREPAANAARKEAP
jgi:thiamine biosynthesis lipoprotein